MRICRKRSTFLNLGIFFLIYTFISICINVSFFSSELRTVFVNHSFTVKWKIIRAYIFIYTFFSLYGYIHCQSLWLSFFNTPIQKAYSVGRFVLLGVLWKIKFLLYLQVVREGAEALVVFKYWYDGQVWSSAGRPVCPRRKN